MKTDEQIAEEYLDTIHFDYSLVEEVDAYNECEKAVIFGLKKGREIERIQFNDEIKSVIGDIQGEMMEKALRFSEWTAICQLEFIENVGCWDDIDGNRCYTSELYSSKKLNRWTY